MPLADDDPITVVLVLDHAHVTGGQAKVAFDSAFGLQARGHRPIVFAAAGPVAETLTQAGVEVVCLGQTDLLNNPSRLVAAAQGIWNAEAAAALGALLDRLPRDRTVVHVHGWAKALSPAIAAPIRASGLPAVYTMHEYFLLCPNGGFYNYRTHATCGLKPLSTACWTTNCDSRNYPRKLWRAARQVIMERVARLPAVFSDYICISKFQLDVIGDQLPPGVRLHEISNPIAATDHRRKLDPPTGPFAFNRRNSPEHGPFLFAEAARLAGVVPTFVGHGPATAELAARYPEARLLGWKEGAEVQDAIRAARALVFPSLWYEGQPLTVLEAKGLATPVIVSDGCAGREEIEHGVSGLWFRSGDAGSLADALRTMRDDAVVARMSDAAHAHYWADPPSLERHVAAITAVYRTLRPGRAVAPGPAAARLAAA